MRGTKRGYYCVRFSADMNTNKHDQTHGSCTNNVERCVIIIVLYVVVGGGGEFFLFEHT